MTPNSSLHHHMEVSPIPPISNPPSVPNQSLEIISPTFPETTPTSSKNLNWNMVTRKKDFKHSKPSQAQLLSLPRSPATEVKANRSPKKATNSGKSSHPPSTRLAVKQSPNIAKPSPTSRSSQVPTGSPPNKTTYLAAATAQSNRLMKDLQTASNQQKLEYLLKQPLPVEKRIDSVVSVVLTTTLTRKALLAPIVAWTTLVSTISNHPPLMISLINNKSAEVFMDSRHITSLTTNLPSEVIIANMEKSSSHLTQRRAMTYLRGYYKTLRLSALQGLSHSCQLQLLEYAYQSLSKTFANPLVIAQWKKTIAYDIQKTSNCR